MNDIIATTGITKRYGSLTAVNDVSLSIHQGEVYGFLGLNGAGKTTTIRMLLGMVRPNSGEAFTLGQKIASGKGPWDKVGYLVETPSSYPELSVRENLEIFRRLRSIADPKAVDNVIDKLALREYANARSRNLSLGNSQRLGLAKAMIHDPEVLILDEPSNGLDPMGIVEVRELLKRLAAEKGVTVLVSSHNLAEIAKLATRIGVIHRGRLIRELNTSELEADLESYFLKLIGSSAGEGRP